MADFVEIDGLPVSWDVADVAPPDRDGFEVVEGDDDPNIRRWMVRTKDTFVWPDGAARLRLYLWTTTSRRRVFGEIGNDGTSLISELPPSDAERTVELDAVFLTPSGRLGHVTYPADPTINRGGIVLRQPSSDPDEPTPADAPVQWTTAPDVRPVSEENPFATGTDVEGLPGEVQGDHDPESIAYIYQTAAPQAGDPSQPDLATITDETWDTTIPAEDGGRFLRRRGEVTGLIDADTGEVGTVYGYGPWSFIPIPDAAAQPTAPVVSASETRAAPGFEDYQRVTVLARLDGLPAGTHGTDYRVYWNAAGAGASAEAVEANWEPMTLCGDTPLTAPTQAAGAAGAGLWFHMDRYPDVEAGAPDLWKEGYNFIAQISGAFDSRRINADAERITRNRYRVQLLDGSGNATGNPSAASSPMVVGEFGEAPEPEVPEPAPGEWTPIPIRTAEEKALGLEGGESNQFLHSAWRDPKNPNLIIWGQDMGAVWWSNSATPRWNNSGNMGLWCFMTQSVAIHPTTGDWYTVQASGYVQDNRHLQGIYRKTAAEIAKGATGRWELVHQEDFVHNGRWIHETITFPTDGSIEVAINRRNSNDSRPVPPGGVREDNRHTRLPSRIVRSPSGNPGTWTEVDTLGISAYGYVTGLYAHPTIAGFRYLTTWRGGLATSENGGASWTKRSGTGGLPLGSVLNLSLSADGDKAYIPVSPLTDATYQSGTGAGVYYSGNRAVNSTRINTPTNAQISKIFASPVDFGTGNARLYLVCRQQDLRYSGDNGASWTYSNMIPRPGRPGGSTWRNMLLDQPHTWLATILPHPTVRNEFVGSGTTAWFQTVDGGANVNNASAGHMGYAASVGQAHDFHETNQNRFALFIYDNGWCETSDYGDSWIEIGPNVADPRGGTLHRSTHSGARLWNQNAVVTQLGLIISASYFRTVRSTNPHNPGTYSIVSPWTGYSEYIQRKRGDENIIYHEFGRSTNAGASFAAWPANAGRVLGMCYAHPHVIYGVRGSGSSTVVTISQNSGASFTDLVTVGWSLWGDPRFPIFEPDPIEIGAFWTRSSGFDLARYSSSTGWKTDFNIRSQVRATIPGGVPSGLGQSINDVCVDMGDRNHVLVRAAIPGASKVMRMTNAWSANPTCVDVTGNLPFTPGGRISSHPITREFFISLEGLGNYRRKF